MILNFTPVCEHITQRTYYAWIRLVVQGNITLSVRDLICHFFHEVPAAGFRQQKRLSVSLSLWFLSSSVRTHTHTHTHAHTQTHKHSSAPPAEPLYVCTWAAVVPVWPLRVPGGIANFHTDRHIARPHLCSSKPSQELYQTDRNSDAY